MFWPCLGPGILCSLLAPLFAFGCKNLLGSDFPFLTSGGGFRVRNEDHLVRDTGIRCITAMGKLSVTKHFAHLMYRLQKNKSNPSKELF
uniref:Putative secreted protein n=1 Tax=Ixodes scapularis TaxID=6945 RepID=A0A4D5REL9_IXOSC